MTCFDVHERKTDLVRQSRGGHISIDQPLQFVVATDDRSVVGTDPEFGVQQRMVVGDSWPRCGIDVGTAEPSGVCKLQAHQEPVECPESSAVGPLHFLQQNRETWTVFAHGQRLPDGYRYASDNNSDWLDVEQVQRLLAELE